MRLAKLRFAVIAISFGCVQSGHAQEAATHSSTPDFFLLPIEIEHDFGATNGDATLLRIMPLYSFPMGGSAKLVNLNLLTFADTPAGIPGKPGNPDPLPGGHATGAGDLIHASFYTPDTNKKSFFGYGAILSLPMASDDLLGTGKWAVGPSLRYVHRSENWTVGGLAGQLWSFAGDSNRDDTSQFMLRGSARRQFGNDWYFVYAPIITANWRVEQGNKWLVPLGGGIGRRFDVRSKPWAWSVQAYYNAIRPDGAPVWSLRFSLIPAIALDGYQSP